MRTLTYCRCPYPAGAFFSSASIFSAATEATKVTSPCDFVAHVIASAYY